MDKARLEQFYTLFEQMVSIMTDPEHFVREDLIGVLEQICELFRLAKGVTEIYMSPELEAAQDGEILVDFDNGKADTEIITRRLIGAAGSVVIGRIFVSEDAQDLSGEELEKIDLVVRCLLSFVSRNRLSNAVERLGYYDEDGYPNVRSYNRFLEGVNARGQITKYTAACYNLRHFSMVNRDLGRERGDAVMLEYFRLLEMAAGEDGIVCRLGGDNFLMFFQKELTDQVLEIFAGVPVQYDEKNGKRTLISATAGVFIVPDDFVMEHPGQILERVYGALNTAKTEQYGSIVFSDEKMLALREKMVRVHNAFPDALRNREFYVYYQPKVNVFDGRIVGAEALCRWIKNGKVVPPMEFIPVLEQGTDICALDFYMLDRVCEDIRRWLDQGRQVVRISVNLSRKHLVDVNLLEHIMEIVDRHHVPHQYIEVELTETTTDVAFRDLKRVVNSLQLRGICTSVDDFGVGYSSLNLIREIPWNVLKIDRCFLPGDLDSENSITSLMFRHVVQMAHEMGLECVTEGVETIKQVETLRKAQCSIAQGYFFDKPLPVEEFEQRMEQGAYI